MKTMFFKAVVATMFFGLTSCSNEEETYVPQEVDLTLDYSFMESGNMSRGIGEDTYNAFYDKYLKTKILTPTTYVLEFKEKTTGAKATVNGYWDKKDAIRLTEGVYEVTGYSRPSNTNYVSDTVFISFNEEVKITKDMSSLNLTAQYDSYLLLFDDENYSDAYYYYNSTSYNNETKKLYRGDSNYSLFVRQLKSENSESIKLTRLDSKKITIELNKFPFEIGKYYYFNDMTNSFDIPKMESGN